MKSKVLVQTKWKAKEKKNDTKREECVCGQEGDLKGLSEYIVWDK